MYGKIMKLRFFISALLLMAGLMLMDSCDNSDDSPSVPVISAFSPGSEGTAVVITGNNFSTIPSENIVSFNGVPSTVAACTATQLVTTVPAGTTTGKITVTVKGYTATSESDFTIDPPVIKEKQVVLTLQPNGCNGKDAVISEIVPDNNYGNLEDIHLYAWTQGGILNVNRVGIDFDLFSIPANARIDSAFLSLYFNNTSRYGSKHSGENSFVIQRITSGWDESTVSWNTQPTTITNNQVAVNGSISATQDFPNINMTTLIRDIIANRNNSYGLMLKLQNEDPYKILLFESSDHQNEHLRPKLDVYYTTTE